MEVKFTCPLGHTCEKAVDDRIERCAWFVKMEGNHPQTGEFVSERRCAMAWMPMLQVEGNGQVIHVASAIETMRNETAKRQDAALELVKRNGKEVIACQ